MLKLFSSTKDDVTKAFGPVPENWHLYIALFEARTACEKLASHLVFYLFYKKFYCTLSLVNVQGLQC